MAAPNGGNGGFIPSMPILDGKNYDHWVIRIEAILGFQEILDIVKDGISEKDDGVARKIDYKARCLFHQCVDLANFDKISKATTAKEAWDTLQKAYGGAEKTKKLKLQSLRK